MTFIERINRDYFNNQLSPEALSLLEPVNNQREEVQQWVERMSRQMKRQRFGAENFNELLALIVGNYVTGLLPGAWRGFVPPITLKGRHVLIDDYLESNQWKRLQAGDRMLDLGCGFPPLTTLDTARRFHDISIKAADPSFARYLVRDSNGDYACFDEKTELLYFQPGVNEPERWEKLLSDSEKTKEYFKCHLIPVLPALPGREGELGSAEHEGFTVVENPVLEYSLPNLSFDRKGIGSSGLGTFQVLRCFNVLCYFDRSFRDNTISWAAGVLEEGGIFLEGMDWSKSRHARYSVYRKENGKLVPKEYAFSIENMRPLEIIAFYALHDDDYGTGAMSKLVGILRADETFRKSVDQRMDEILVRSGFQPRSEKGYLRGLEENADPATFDTVADHIGRALEREGYAQKAVEILNKNGYKSWINCVGHIAVDPANLEV